jgi:hypothetical protein
VTRKQAEARVESERLARERVVRAAMAHYDALKHPDLNWSTMKLEQALILACAALARKEKKNG